MPTPPIPVTDILRNALTTPAAAQSTALAVWPLTEERAQDPAAGGSW